MGALGRYGRGGLTVLAALAVELAAVPSARSQSATSAAPQPPPDGSAGVSVSEIVVTAQKRSQSIQDVPISIRALGEQELSRVGAGSLQGFAGFAPSLSLTEQGPLRTQIVVRGVSTGDLRFDRPEVRESVGLYLDEAPISTQVVSPNLGLLDIERIEVLRGPQGTLYGAGSLSGTIRMITHKPDLTEASGSVDSTVSSTEHGGTNYEANGVVNIPVVKDVFALRAIGFYRDNDGYIDNLTNGKQNINFARDYGGRLSARIKPDSKLTIDATVTYQHTKLGGDFSYRAEAGDLKEITPLSEPSSSNVLLGATVAAYDLGAFTLTNAASYLKKDTTFSLDAGGFAAFYVEDPGAIDGLITTRFHQREFTEELRISSNDKGPVTYTAGIFYQHQDNLFTQNLPFAGIDAAGGFDSADFGAATDVIYDSKVRLKTRQIAGFGEVTIKPTRRLAVVLGGRYFDVLQTSAVDEAGILAVPQVGRQNFRFNANGFNPKVNVSYDVTRDHMVYVQASKGFRLGGTNEPVPVDLCAADLAALGLDKPATSFQSDSLWNYEGGVKTRWAGGKLTANVAGYYIEWKQPPLAADFKCGFSTIINAGRFNIRGVEFDLEAHPVQGLTLRAGGAYNDGRLSGDLPQLGGVDGDRTPQTPRFTANASADYEFPLRLAGRDTRAFAHADLRHVGDRTTVFPGNPNYSGYFLLPSYEIVDLRFGARFAPVSVELFLENVFDERPILNESRFARAFDKMPGTAIYTIRPRTGGIKFGYRF